MTDHFLDLNTMSQVGRNPMTPLNKAVYNVHKDDDEILDRRRNVDSSSSLYPGPCGDEDMSIYPHELCFAAKATYVKKNRSKQNAKVLSVLNGAFERGTEIWEVQDSLQYMGVALSGARHDSTNQNPEMDLAVQLTGTHSIINTGPERIFNGDQIMWEVPPPDHQAYENARRGSRRIPMWIVPYNPILDKITRQSIIRLMQLKENGEDYETKRNQGLIQGVEVLRKSFGTAFLLSVHLALSSGLVTLTSDLSNTPTESGKRKTASKNYANKSKDDKFSILQSLANALGLIEGVEDKSLVVYNHKGGFEERHDLNKAVRATFMADDDSWLVQDFDAGTRRLPSGTSGVILAQQLQYLEDLLGGIDAANRSKSNRIIGKALSIGEPGKDIDVLLK